MHLRAVPDPRPDLRHPSRDEVGVYRVRAEIDGSEPPIWRLFDLRSDLALDVLHQVLQVAFDWDDAHLHRYSLGGDAFDRRSQVFLCQYDVDNDEGWGDDDGGIPDADVRVDEALNAPGDVLHYLYDYGDGWQLTLRLEQLLADVEDVAPAVVVGGQRAAPPEDCGHVTDGPGLAELLDDPDRFEPERLNSALRGPYFVLREAGVEPGLVDLVHRLTYTPYGPALTDRAVQLASASAALDDSVRIDSLRPFQWFLDRAAQGGITLTGAGYLKPTDVEAASEVIPAMADSIGKNNRETHCGPLLHFRLSLQSVGLLRKSKGALLLTRVGAAAQQYAGVLWKHLASRLVPRKGDQYTAEATLLLLLYFATSADRDLPYDEVAALLSELGWRFSDGRPVAGYSLYRLPVREILLNTTDRPIVRKEYRRVSPAAAALAHAALRLM